MVGRRLEARTVGHSMRVLCLANIPIALGVFDLSRGFRTHPRMLQLALDHRLGHFAFRATETTSLRRPASVVVSSPSPRLTKETPGAVSSSAYSVMVQPRASARRRSSSTWLTVV